ncbi:MULTISPECIES: TetR/AcrR family transcriptional regulator [Streptomyces]|uniref:TetR/AcrR family transcriptional regulator n=3 Tax=Streptomyces TaxID=1883 RepID=A0ABD5J4F8_9ACTN|nr:MULTISPECIES: TetR/AcrR family transcriptional regulator [Streptomyces]MEE4582603.1 TetR/AcrR family transcriptional regulator [Streptomyces sp. DSM 41602]KUL67049.1 TetR family transcriptional regulator [Streptomyces violaceusniger]RSS45614.1 TetR/AcrR family transcriptional regulator [Streptomyces sp. WAC05858]WJD99467.1 TetR/AcrR family transcriptional regulator [Streptomyces antimycoticus]WTA81712.1 TetR family transcriptional regulator [Streptomyces antimycoticus]
MSESKADLRDETAKPRRRQARGERRIQQLLDAAAHVFCRTGYTSASTNAIAREAGVSPGTLYQFFPNKEAIAVELGERLNRRMVETHGTVFTPENVGLPLGELLDTVLDPMIEFNCANPVFLALLQSSDAPGRLLEEHAELHDSIQDRISELIGVRNPGLSPERRTHTTTMAFALFKVGLTLILGHEGAEREAYVAELKAALYGYLAPVLGTEGVRARP